MNCSVLELAVAKGSGQEAGGPRIHKNKLNNYVANITIY
jgi:hypothetical protein